MNPSLNINLGATVDILSYVYLSGWVVFSSGAIWCLLIQMMKSDFAIGIGPKVETAFQTDRSVLVHSRITTDEE